MLTDPALANRKTFDDFTLGESGSYGAFTLDRAELVAFARDYDPQPMHLDPHSAQAQLMGGKIASGWHTISRNMRLMADGLLNASTGLGSPGVDKLRWLQPVRAGDTLTGSYSVLGRKVSARNPARGLVNFRFLLTNQHGEAVLEQINLILFGRREGAQNAFEEGVLPAPPAPEDFPTGPIEHHFGLIEDLRPGMIARVGERQFDAAHIIDFARQFDPQPFHLSEEAGRKTHFGGLCASGWQTAATWMRLTVDFWQKLEAEGVHVPKRGPGMGFDDLQWRRPVMAGDTLTYYSHVLDARRSQSRPGWGIVTLRNYAINQNGVPVFAFRGLAMWEARV